METYIKNKVIDITYQSELIPPSCFRPVKCKAFPGFNPRNRFAISGDKKAGGINSRKTTY